MSQPSDVIIESLDCLYHLIGKRNLSFEMLQNLFGIVVKTATEKTIKVRVPRQFVHPKVHKVYFDFITCSQINFLA